MHTFAANSLLLSMTTALTVVSLHGVALSDDSKPNTSMSESWEKMIDQLANNNPPPEIKPRRDKLLPIFGADYDWDEQSRVRKAFVAITRMDSEELWDELVEHIDDKRYSLTMSDNGADFRNYSVGNLCEMIAVLQLQLVSHLHSDPRSRDRPDVYLDVGVDDIGKWRKARKGKKLYELQFEVCQVALHKLTALDELSINERKAVEFAIKGKMDTIKKSQKAIHLNLPTDGHELFNAERARRVRDTQ